MKHLNFKTLYPTKKEAKIAAERFAKEKDYSVEMGTADLIADFDISHKALQDRTSKCRAYIVKNGTPYDDIFAWWNKETYKAVITYMTNQHRNAETLSELANAINDYNELNKKLPYSLYDIHVSEIEETCEKRGWKYIFGDDGNYHDIARSDKEYLTLLADETVACFDREDI